MNLAILLALAPLCHLTGDYVLQSQVMSNRKTSSWPWALVHATVYTVPFLVLTWHPLALAVILGSHAWIDRYRWGRRWCEWYGTGYPGIWQSIADTADDLVGLERSAFKGPDETLGIVLTIVADNTMHLWCNTSALALTWWLASA